MSSTGITLSSNIDHKGRKITEIMVKTGMQIDLIPSRPGELKVVSDKFEQIIDSKTHPNILIKSSTKTLQVKGRLKALDFDNIIIQGGESKDQIDLEIETAPLSETKTHRIWINTGAGDDDVNLNITGTIGTTDSIDFNTKIFVDLGPGADRFIGGCKFTQSNNAMQRTYLRVLADPDETKAEDEVRLYNSPTLSMERSKGEYTYLLNSQHDLNNPQRNKEFEEIDTILSSLPRDSFTINAYRKGSIRSLEELRAHAAEDKRIERLIQSSITQESAEENKKTDEVKTTKRPQGNGKDWIKAPE